jgi:hypothetical protein
MSLLKAVMSEWLMVLGDRLGDFANAKDPRALQQAFKTHEQLIVGHLIFNRPHLREQVEQQIDKAIAALSTDPTYYEEVKKMAKDLLSARQALAHHLSQDLPRPVLEKLATTYHDKTMEKHYRSLFKDNKEEAVSLWHVFPKKGLMLDATTNAFKRVSFMATIREEAQKKLRAKNALCHVKNVTDLTPDPATGVAIFSPDHFEAVMNKDKALIEKTRALRRKLYKVDSFFSESLDKKLKNLFDEKFLWFSPGFQGSSARLAKQMVAQYQLITESAETLIGGLEQHQLALEERLDSLPTVAELNLATNDMKFKKRMTAHRLELQKHIDKVKKDLDVPKAVLEKMYGTGLSANAMLACNGVLETMQDARTQETGQLLDTTSLHVSYRDYLPENIPKELKPTEPLTVLNSGVANVAATSDYFKEVCSVPRGHLRVYEISTPEKPNPKAGQPNEPAVLQAQVIGRFTEAPSDDFMKPDNTFVVLTFPSDKGVQPPPTAKELHEQRVEFAMSLMIQMIMNLRHEPSKAHPLHITSLNAEELKYLTAAALAIQELSGKKVDPKSIEIHSGVPKDFPNVGWTATLGIATEGLLWKINKLDGFYEKFKATACVEELKDAIQALDKQKFISPAHQKELLKNEHTLINMGYKMQEQLESDQEKPPVIPTVRCI